jgi:hypothetical protein
MTNTPPPTKLQVPNYGRPSQALSADNVVVALAYLAKHPTRYLFPTIGDKRQPAIKDNLALASNDPEQLKAWQQEHERRGRVMWACAARKSGLIPLDADLQKPGAQEALDKLVGEIADDSFSNILDTETATTPSGGVHLIFKGDHKFSQSKLGAGLDVPNYFMIPGQMRSDGKRYKLTKDVPAMVAPAELQARVKPAEPERTRTFTDDAVPLDLFKKMLAATPYTGGPSGMDDRHSYGGCLNFLMAAHEAAGGDEADYLEAVIDWCFADPNQDWTQPTSREWVERKWASFNDSAANAVTRASWFKVLDATGGGDLVGEAVRPEDFETFRDDPANDNEIEAAKTRTEAVPEAFEPFPEPVSMADLLSGTWPKPEFLVEGWIMKGYPNTFNADGGTGKTTVSTQFAVGVSVGIPVLGRATMQAPVLLVLCEDGEGVTQERITAAIEREAALNGIDPATLPITTWCLLGHDVTLAKISDQGIIKELPFYKRLDEQMAKMPGCFVVLDSLIDVVQMEMKDPAPANAFFKKLLTGLCRKHNATILVLAHPSKASMQDGSWSHGSLAFKNAVRQGIAMRIVPGQQHRVLWSLKHNYGGDDETKLYFEYPLFTLTSPSDSANPAVRLDAAILECVIGLIREGKGSVTRNNRGGGTTPRMIADQLNASGMTPATVTWQRVQTVMVTAERNGVLRYVKGYGKTEAHYEWLGDQEQAPEQPGEFDDALAVGDDD